MENEREKSLLKELEEIQDQKPRGDSLLTLIKRLQRQCALGPFAKGARSPSKERAIVARAVTKYLRDTKSGPSSEGSEPAVADWIFVCDSCGTTTEPCYCVRKYLSKGNLSWCHATERK